MQLKIWRTWAKPLVSRLEICSLQSIMSDTWGPLWPAGRPPAMSFVQFVPFEAMKPPWDAKKPWRSWRLEPKKFKMSSKQRSRHPPKRSKQRLLKQVLCLIYTDLHLYKYIHFIYQGLFAHAILFSSRQQFALYGCWVLNGAHSDSWVEVFLTMDGHAPLNLNLPQVNTCM